MGTLNMPSREVSMPVKEAIIRLKKENKSIREIAEALDVAKSTIWYIIKKKESTGELSNSKRSGRPRKTTKVDDCRILSLVKENPFTTSSQVKNTLEEVGVSLSRSTVKRRLHECKAEFTSVSEHEASVTDTALFDGKNSAACSAIVPVKIVNIKTEPEEPRYESD